MANLLCLSNELLIAIYSSSSTLQFAAALSGANKRLRAIWLEHTDHIVTEILKSHIEAYEDALELATLEETWTTDSPATTPVSIRQCLPRLLHNADLAASMAMHWKNKHSTDDGEKSESTTSTSAQASYYLMRKLLLARRHPEANLLRSLYTSLRILPEESLDVHEDFSDWLLHSGPSNDDAKASHGILKPEEEWDEYDKVEYRERGCVNWDDWEWVGEVFEGAACDSRHVEEEEEAEDKSSELYKIMFEVPEERYARRMREGPIVEFSPLPMLLQMAMNHRAQQAAEQQNA